ncbi:MAG: O-antigen polysaccharide polymerase Wzy [Parabacteroides sp.]|nr:O-antigen polysaccharide polymerase Wzy [Parabacteroides sp.]
MLVSEMGGSLRVLTTTIKEIDQGIVHSEPTLLYTVLKGIVPQVDILEIVGITEPERWRLSQWITDAHGSNAGWGFSMYAEAYYNFHEFGFLFMGLFGYIYVWLENKIEKWYMKGWTVMASGWLFAAVYLIFLARADSLLFVTRLRYALYLGILCMCLRGRISIPETKFTIRKS